MFDRRVHHFDQSGRITKVAPYREHVRNGQMTLIVTSDGKLLTPDGKPYPTQLLQEDLKDRYKDLIVGNGNVSRETPVQRNIKVSPLVDMTPIKVDLSSIQAVDSSNDLSDLMPKEAMEDSLVTDEQIDAGITIKRRGRPPKVKMPA